MSLNAFPKILLDNVYDLDTPVASEGEAADFFIESVLDLRSYKIWKSGSAATQFITVDAGSSVNVNALGIVNHNLNTAGVTLSVEYSNDDFSGDINEALAGFVVSDDLTIFKSFPDISERYWRIKIEGATEAPYIGVLMLGEALDFTRHLNRGFDPLMETQDDEDVINEDGQLVSVALSASKREIIASLDTIATSWIENTFRPLWESYISKIKPFFFAWDTDNHETQSYFVSIKRDSALTMPYDPVRRSLTLSMETVKE